jgi:hypothetical protein
VVLSQAYKRVTFHNKCSGFSVFDGCFSDVPERGAA